MCFALYFEPGELEAVNDAWVGYAKRHPMYLSGDAMISSGCVKPAHLCLSPMKLRGYSIEFAGDGANLQLSPYGHGLAGACGIGFVLSAAQHILTVYGFLEPKKLSVLWFLNPSSF